GAPRACAREVTAAVVSPSSRGSAFFRHGTRCGCGDVRTEQACSVPHARNFRAPQALRDAAVED
ncbi:MAG: hypothetical protein K0V04_37170, partial [Deltaproteobacteria bacterium]|nr:hypothetical protein [Deltaproteobacteria bacterium]